MWTLLLKYKDILNSLKIRINSKKMQMIRKKSVSKMLEIKEMVDMIKQMAWNTFKKTGDINTFLEFMEVQNIEKKMNKAEQYGNIQNEGNYNCGTQYERL